MSKISLFKHNEKAYEKLIKALKNNKCTTINHATGTGKSFIALKYLYEHRDKKYLYIAPTYPIIDQLKLEEAQRVRYELINEIDRYLQEHINDNPKNIMYKLALERRKQNETKIVILRCVEFLQKYGRRPLPNSNNQDESQLAMEYESKCIKELGNVEITMLNNIFNNRKSFQKTCNEYIKNIKAIQDLEINH